MTSGGRGRSSKLHQAIDCKMACWTEARPSARRSLPDNSHCARRYSRCVSYSRQLMTAFSVHYLLSSGDRLLSTLRNYGFWAGDFRNRTVSVVTTMHSPWGQWQTFLPKKLSSFQINVFHVQVFPNRINHHITLIWPHTLYPTSVLILLNVNAGF